MGIDPGAPVLLCEEFTAIVVLPTRPVQTDTIQVLMAILQTTQISFSKEFYGSVPAIPVSLEHVPTNGAWEKSHPKNLLWN